MTEKDLLKHAVFENLPFYDDTDERYDSLFRHYDTNYDGSVVEAQDDVEFWRCIQDPQLVAKGAVRYATNDVKAVFWKKREA